MEKKTIDTNKEEPKVEDLSPKQDVQGGANGATRISDKQGTVGGTDVLPVR